MRRIYLAGPMTGLPQLNFPAFNAEAARLRALGYDVVNPAELNPHPACIRTAAGRKRLRAAERASQAPHQPGERGRCAGSAEPEPAAGSAAPRG